MKINDIILEKSVMSSWITDIQYNRRKRVISFRLANNRQYAVFPISRSMFERWLAAPSKGKFFHDYIKYRYNVERILKTNPR